MTYCVALRLNEGLVCLSDTRTNAGVDNISMFRKTFTWENPGERVIVMMTAGNLAITQAVISLLNENLEKPENGIETLFTAPTMFRAAEIVGDAMRIVQARYGPGLAAMGENAGASIVLAGQRAGGVPRLFLIYSAGNFIESSDESPFFQIGEHKYGKPILDRMITPETSLETAVTAALLSMDSTLRSNLSVGMPLDLTVIHSGAPTVHMKRRIEPDDKEFQQLSAAWSDALRQAFEGIVRLGLLGIGAKEAAE